MWWVVRQVSPGWFIPLHYWNRLANSCRSDVAVHAVLRPPPKKKHCNLLSFAAAVCAVFADIQVCSQWVCWSLCKQRCNTPMKNTEKQEKHASWENTYIENILCFCVWKQKRIFLWWDKNPEYFFKYDFILVPSNTCSLLSKFNLGLSRLAEVLFSSTFLAAGFIFV